MNTEAIYSEASQWLRQVNSLCWQVAAIFVPLSIGAFMYAIEKPENKYWLFFGSSLLWLIWVYMVMIYGRSASIARTVLENIEATENVSAEQAFYSRQGTLYGGKLGSKYLLLLSTAAFFSGWILFFIFR